MDIATGRNFLRSNWEKRSEIISDQQKNIPQPPLEKSFDEGSKLYDLISPDEIDLGNVPLKKVIEKRKSRRKFKNVPLSIEELSFLLWAIQGVKEIVKNGYATFRTVPSAGARHPLETYLAVYNVEDLPKGLYRYLPLEHKLLLIEQVENLTERIIDACMGQRFAGECAVTFIWTAIPYRTEWRYSILSHKVILLDAGHVCQNLYLASEAINCGTCAIAAYDQQKMDELLSVDGYDELTIYVAPVGKI